MSAKTIESSRADEDARWADSGEKLAEERRWRNKMRVLWALLTVLVVEVAVIVGGVPIVVCKVYGLI